MTVLNDITNFISAVGVPVAMCAALFWYMVTQNQKMLEAIQSLTLAVTKLSDRLDEIEKKGEKNGSYNDQSN